MLWRVRTAGITLTFGDWSSQRIVEIHAEPTLDFTVTDSTGELIDKLTITDFEDYDYLKKFGDVMYEPVNGAVEKDATGLIRQGYTEQSNVNVVSEMVNLINITRAYEANQKVIKAMDDLLQIDVSSVGKI